MFEHVGEVCRQEVRRAPEYLKSWEMYAAIALSQKKLKSEESQDCGSFSGIYFRNADHSLCKRRFIDKNLQFEINQHLNCLGKIPHIFVKSDI